MRKNGLYLRLSIADGDLGKDNKDESNSIDNQRTLLVNFVQDRDDLSDEYIEYVDDGYSGTNFERPAFKRMIEDAKTGKIDTIIVKDFSRFGRDYIGVGDYLEQVLPILGIRFISLNNNYDSNDYLGKTMGMDMAIHNLVNNLYSKDISKKLKSALRVKWRNGQWTGGKPPFGYLRNKETGEWLIDPVAGKYVRMVFDKAIEGCNCKRDFTYVDDIVEGVKRVMQRAPERKIGEDGLPVPPYAVYNIGNSNPENLLDFVTILQEELIRAEVLPNDYDFEAHKKLVPMQPGDVPVTYADTSALERDFGFKPSTDLRTGLRRFAEWYKEFYQV